MTNSSLSNSQPEVGNPNGWLRAEVEHLLGKLYDPMRNQVQTIDPVPLRQNVYEQLLPYFESTALEYVDLAEQIIPTTEIHSIDYYYGEVLREITEHARLLLSIRSVDVSQPLLQRLEAFQGILWHIAQYVPRVRGEKPLLIPILSNRFTYFHLNYVNGVGIIGVPPDALVPPYYDLAILWHEVAGYWVAQQAANAHYLRKRTLELNKRLSEASVWGCYRDMYKQSIQQRLTVKLDINEDSFRIVGIPGILNYFMEHNPKRQEPNIDTDLAWQNAWFGQILADLFGVQVLGDTMVHSLRSALSRAYMHQELGDLCHPPPSLRLKMAHKYWEANQERALDNEGLHAEDKLAGVIVGYVHTQYPEMAGMVLPNDGIIPLVKALVRGKLNDHELMTFPAIANAVKKSQASVPSIKRSNLIWDQAGFTQSARNKFKEDKGDAVEAQRCMAQLRRIKFAETDGATGGTTGATTTGVQSSKKEVTTSGSATTTGQQSSKRDSMQSLSNNGTQTFSVTLQVHPPILGPSDNSLSQGG